MSRLARDQSIIVTAITWRNSYTGSINKSELSTLPSLLAADAGTLVLGFRTRLSHRELQVTGRYSVSCFVNSQPFRRRPNTPLQPTAEKRGG